MTRKNLLTLAVLTAFSAGSMAALAQADASAAAPAKPARASLDTNQDGHIDRTEAAAHPRLLQRFDQIDADNDGRLSASEMPARGGKHGMRGRHGPRGGGHGIMPKLDTDNDGRISRAEAQAGNARFAERFDRMDANNDGYIDRADHQQRARERSAAWFAEADTNGDGQLSKAEHEAAQARRWESRGTRGPGRTPAPAN